MRIVLAIAFFMTLYFYSAAQDHSNKLIQTDKIVKAFTYYKLSKMGTCVSPSEIKMIQEKSLMNYKTPNYKQGAICNFEDQLNRKKIPIDFQLGKSKY